MAGGPLPDVSPHTFRDALARWATGVAVVAVRDARGVAATTVSSFSSLTLEPPLVLVALSERAQALPRIQAAGRYVINVLSSEQVELADRCSRTEVREDDLDARGLIPGALVSLSCTLHDSPRYGTHTLLVGRVHEVVTLDRAAEPLLYWNRQYRNLSDLPPEPAA